MPHPVDPVESDSSQDFRDKSVGEDFLGEADLARKWETFMDHSGVGAWVCEIDTGVIRYSAGWAAMLGFTSEEVEGMKDPWSELIHPEDRARVIALHLEHVDGSTDYYECEQRLRHRSGEYRWFLSRCRVELDRRGRAIRSLGYQIDITDLKDRLSQEGQMGIIRTGYVQQAPVHISVFDRSKREFTFWSRQEDAESIWRALPLRCEGEVFLYLLHGAPGDVLEVGEEGYREQLELFELDQEDDEDLIGLVVRQLPREASSLNQATRTLGLLHGKLRALRNENRSLESLASSLQDTRTRLEKLSQIDSLTGLLNRRAFDERLEDLMDRGRHFCLLLIDIDHFKAINDTYGHQVGDSVLREASRVLRSSQGPGHDMARIGGEEFAWIIPEVNLSVGVGLAEELRQTFAQEKWVSGPLTISLGVAQTRGSDTASSLYDRADSALYDAKRSGRNQVKSETPHESSRRAA
jgi:diguanylate cyclase (GGDEF)-like protein/PAS domain S-box-containing protein